MRFLCRHDGHEANDGEVGCAKDSSGDEENDLRGDRGLQRHHQLQGLCENDAWQAISCSQTVSVFKHVSVILCACSLSILFLILANTIMLNCRTISCFDWVQLFLDMSTCVCLILSAHPAQDRHICAIISQWERNLLWQVMSSPWDTRDWINTRNLALVQYKPLVPQYQY